MTDAGTGLRPVSFKKGRASAPRLSPKREPGKTHERYWTETENEVLRQYFPQGGMPAAGAHLPNRSRSSIYAQAHKLGLTRSGQPQTREPVAAPADIDDTLRARWPLLEGRGAVNDLAAELGLPRWWISHRARKLELTVAHKKEPPWTEAEKALLAKVPVHDPDRCAEIFREHGFSRSPTAIRVHSKRNGIFARNSRATFSGTGAAKLLGMDNKTVTTWCVAGEMKATRRGSRRLPQQGGDIWDIQPHDLRQFIMENLARIDIRKVEKIAFVELLARCPRCEEKGR